MWLGWSSCAVWEILLVVLVLFVCGESKLEDTGTKPKEDKRLKDWLHSHARGCCRKDGQGSLISIRSPAHFCQQALGGGVSGQPGNYAPGLVCQYVGNSIFKHFIIDDRPPNYRRNVDMQLPRSLRKKITKSSNRDLLLCLFDLLDDGDDDDHESTKWLESHPS